MAPKGGLGRGLDALIPGGEEIKPSGGAIYVAIENIKPNPHQPRKQIQEEDLQELAASIREHGILQPLIVSQEAGEDVFILIAGERRLRAASLAGLESVPVHIRPSNDQERLELALIENLQREDLTALEAAEAYQQLADDFNLSHEEIAVKVGKSRVAITNTLRLLKLPDSIRRALEDLKISEGHARTLLALESPQAQIAAMQTILTHDLNVRQAEELVRKMSGVKPNVSQKNRKSTQLLDMEEQLRDKLGTKVIIQHGKKGGTIMINYYSEEELNALAEKILNA